MELYKQKCVPCEGGVLPFKNKETKEYLKKVPKWKAIKNHHLYREFKFKDFKSAQKFSNKVGKIAERENHHPDINLGWGYVNITTYTHAINGLSINDFILAAKINKI
jgi:4a-hydroxytetrahydrobiopterin dehydratase